MNRRTFLSSLLKGTLTAVAAPQIVTHGLKLKFTRAENLWVPNPNYEASNYRVFFIADERAFEMIKVGPLPVFPNAYQASNATDYVPDTKPSYFAFDQTHNKIILKRHPSHHTEGEC